MNKHDIALVKRLSDRSSVVAASTNAPSPRLRADGDAGLNAREYRGTELPGALMSASLYAEPSETYYDNSHVARQVVTRRLSTSATHEHMRPGESYGRYT